MYAALTFLRKRIQYSTNRDLGLWLTRSMFKPLNWETLLFPCVNSRTFIRINRASFEGDECPVTNDRSHYPRAGCR